MTRTAIDGQLKNKPSYLAGANEGADYQHSDESHGGEAASRPPNIMTHSSVLSHYPYD
jgi:hypothetical protein